MSGARVCLYCQHPNAVNLEQCEQCSMPLPASETSAQARTLKRFQWFCLSLTLFCLVMFFWLPRDFY